MNEQGPSEIPELSLDEQIQAYVLEGTPLNPQTLLDIYGQDGTELQRTLSDMTTGKEFSDSGDPEKLERFKRLGALATKKTNENDDGSGGTLQSTLNTMSRRGSGRSIYEIHRERRRIVWG